MSNPRISGPFDYMSGSTFYQDQNGMPHRLHEPAIICPNGDRYWCVNGFAHREDGPAIDKVNGEKYWYKNGKLHRLDGPAGELANGEKIWSVYGHMFDRDESISLNVQISLIVLENGNGF